MIEVSITIYPQNDKIQQVRDLILHQCEVALENHKGCITFIPSMSVKDDRTFYIKEKWETTRDLVTYRNSELFLEYNKTVKTLVDEDIKVESFEHM